MKRRTYIYIIIIILSLTYSILDYNMAKHQSYDKYVAGEYTFRQTAYTVDTHADTWWATPEAQNADYSDPRTMLLCSNNMDVYVENPHDGVCTVYYGEHVIHDFPISNLRFENDDEDYFYGKKRYSYDEYIEAVRSMKKEKYTTRRVSDLKGMISFEKMKPFIIGLFCIEVLFAAVAIILYRSEQYLKVSLILFFGALCSIGFELFTSLYF